MNRMFDPQGVRWDIVGDWLVSKLEIKKNDADRSVYVERKTANSWVGEVEWMVGELEIHEWSYRRLGVSAVFRSEPVFVYATYSTVLGALAGMDARLKDISEAMKEEEE